MKNNIHENPIYVYNSYMPSKSIQSKQVIPLLSKGSNIYHHTILAALVIALGLAYISSLGLCTEACAKSHSYRLYGFTFEFIGMLYFPLLTVTHLLSRQKPIFKPVTEYLVFLGVGAEILFLYVQKNLIGTWCPLCISIASMLAIVALIIIFSKPNKELIAGSFMKTTHPLTRHLFAIATGFSLAFLGLGQQSELKAEEASVKAHITFGNPNSPIDVFVFTDWLCPACESLEPTFEKTVSAINQKALITFVDDPVHEATLNFTPYNLSFMVNNKDQYFNLRKAMHELANNNKEPTDKDISALAAKFGVTLRELNYGTVAMGSKYFDSLIKQFNIEGTPTVIVYNRTTKESKKLEGKPEIDQEKIVKAIDSLVSKG